MSVAGVALPGGRFLWARTEQPLAPLDRVILELPEGDVEGTVVVAPEQLVGLPPHGVDVVIRVLPRLPPVSDCDVLPGADLPPLGFRVEVEEITGTVAGLDPVARLLTIAPDDGREPIAYPAGEPAVHGRE